MELSKKLIKGLQGTVGINVPQDFIFILPEKVLQFGTGVLLRGLPDYFIDKANKQAVFNGRVVVVKSTGNGGTDGFAEQDSLYTHCINGVADGKLVEQTIINASISRVLSAATQWQDILACAAKPEMQIILSNTTEVGIVLVDDDIHAGTTPVSFPGKLLAFLHERYKKLGGTAEAGMVIIPTELIVDNATKLKSIVLEQANRNKLETEFITWLDTQNDFCNSLVDRIVPGKMAPEKHAEMEEKLGYKDGLMIMSEVYSLWAIETKNKSTIAKLSFAQTDSGVVIAPDINKFRELKLRLLNGTHTFSCALAFLSGFETVSQAMENEKFGNFVHGLMVEEIAPCIINENILKEEAEIFAANVIDRFGNPNIQHKWISISVQYTGKMKMRNVPLLLKHYNTSETVPTHMAIGFAAYLQFAKPVEKKDNTYYGFANGNAYKIDDEFAAWYYTNWQGKTTEEAVHSTLGNMDIWGADLLQLNGFEAAVLKYVQQFEDGNFEV